MPTFPHPTRIIYRPADDVRDDPAVVGVANATGIPQLCWNSHYASPLGLGQQYQSAGHGP
jgi:hypothetical protein